MAQKRRLVQRLATLMTCLLFTSAAWADLLFESNVFYFSDSLKPSTDTTNSRLFFDVTFGMPLTKKGSLILAWSVSKLSYSLADTATTEISTLEHGPRLGWFFDKAKHWSIFATYNLIASGTFNDGSGAVTWKGGNSFKVDAGFTPRIGESLYVGIRINYYSASYSEQFDASDNFTKITSSQSMIFPSLTLGFYF